MAAMPSCYPTLTCLESEERSERDVWDKVMRPEGACEDPVISIHDSFGYPLDYDLDLSEMDKLLAFGYELSIETHGKTSP